MSPGLRKEIKEMFIDTPLCIAFGITPQTVILQFLSSHPNKDYTRKELWDLTGISRTTLIRALPPLIRFNLVSVEAGIGRTGGRAYLYKFNPESMVSKRFIPFYEYLVATIKEDEEEGSAEKLSGITID